MTKRFMGWSLAAAVVAVSGSAALACEEAAKTADLKEAKDTKAIAAKSETSGCNLPCCAHDKAAAEAKAETAVKAEVAAHNEKPCAGHDGKGCAKKTTATLAAKAEPAKDAVKPEAATDPGTQR